MQIWRLSQFADLSGRGGLHVAGRWNHINDLIVYCADHPSTALLEMLVRFDPEDAPNTYQILEIEVPDHFKIEVPDLPDDWQNKNEMTRNIWQAFCNSNHAAIMQVPCVIVPQAKNFLLNPNFEDFGEIKIKTIYQNNLDNRFYN